MLSVAAFYQFVSLPDPVALQGSLLRLGTEHGIKGTVLLAPEGINGTVAGESAAMAALFAGLKAMPPFRTLEPKWSSAATMPFGRFKVRLKREIITIGEPAADPNVQVGAYVEPADWNALLTDPSVTVIDTRNAFEVAMGSFAGAVDPGLAKFSEFTEFAAKQLDPARHDRIAIFCTGGIRCEKASALLLQRGFKTVYHLKGGILRYLETVPEATSLWRGACFVFDERVSLGHGLAITTPTPGAAHA